MANSSTNIDLLSASQANKEVTVNAALDAASPAMLYGRRASTSAALTFGYYGGTVMIGSMPTQVANGIVALAANTTNYVEANPADGSVSVNQTGFTSGRTPLYSVMTGASTVASYTDLRVLGGGSVSGVVKSVNAKTPDSSGAVTLSASDVGADASGAASAAIAAHDAAMDPHPQYLTQAEGDARYDTAGAASADLAVHVAAADPHSQYALESTIGQANGIAGLGSDGKVPAAQLPASATSGGTVTSVDLAVPGLLYTVSGGPITGSGALTFSLKTQAKNTFLAGPASGADATPVMRALTQADLPAQPFDLTAFYPGVPSASALVTRVPVARAVTFAAALAGSVGKARIAATAQTDFDVQKNGTSVGTIRFAAAATSATFISASGFTCAAGDIVSIAAPATADATLADVGIVLAGVR